MKTKYWARRVWRF